MKVMLKTALGVALTFATVWATPSVQAEEAPSPEFLLGDLGVRVDLPAGWKMLRWSDWDFKAETNDQMVILFAWATPNRVDPTTVDLEAWAQVHIAKTEEIAGTGSVIDSTELVRVAGNTAAKSQITFFYDDLAMVLSGVTLPIDGQMFHMATVSAKQKLSRSKGSLEELIERLEIQVPAPELVFGPTQEVDGITQTLPDMWREPHPKEAPAAVRQVSALGIEDLEACRMAIRGVANALPDVMVTCQGGLWLGVTDALSFEERDNELKERIFGGAEVAPGEMIELSDRVGFIHDVALPGRTLLMASVPYDMGIARTWVVGGEEEGAQLRVDLEATLQNTTYSGLHPVSVGDQLTYWVNYQPFHPVLLGGVGFIFLVFGASGWLVFRAGRGKSYDDMDLD